MRRWMLTMMCIGTLACAGPAWAHGGHDPDPKAAPAPAAAEAPSSQENPGFEYAGESGDKDEAPGAGFYMEDMDPEGMASDGASTYGETSMPSEDAMATPTLGGSLRQDPLTAISSPLAPEMGDHAAMGDMEGQDMVTPATHTLVPSDSRGYAAAMAITILTGLVFGFLTLKRPLE